MMRTGPQHSTITRAQREALAKIYHRRPTPSFTPCGHKDLRGYRAFRRTAYHDRLAGCVMVPWLSMMLGIEPDGYTHS